MTSIAFLIGFISMSLGSLALYADGLRHHDDVTHSCLHSVVPFIAATSYLAMYLGTGTMVSGDHIVYPQRYADWLVTTPLLLAALSLTGLKDLHGRAGYVISLVVLDMLMIVTGLLSSLSAPEGRLIWFLWSCAAFLGVLYLLWVPIRANAVAAGGNVAAAYRGNLIFLSGVWLLYPVIYAVGPEGVKAVGDPTSVWMILILDVTAKVIYGFVAAGRVRKLHVA